jgi:threonine dehydrogenase-like Zn-dependent dehydrogenase
MKAVVIHAARDLRVEEREPEAAGAGQVEIAVEAGHLRVGSALLQPWGLQLGADRTITVADDPDQLGVYSANKGYFDVQFEASGNERAPRPCGRRLSLIAGWPRRHCPRAIPTA